MNLLSYTLRSSARLSGVAGLTAALLMGCGGSAPPPEREHVREPANSESQNQAGEKGAGGINFHFKNKSTDAHMSIDLGSTDVYLEMSGQPANAEDQTPTPPPSQTENAKTSPKTRHQEPDAEPKDQEPDAEEKHSESKPEQKPEKAARKLDKRQSLHSKPEPEEDSNEEDQGSNEDVTSKVLAGIRKAQELFYQKRYPEALMMVRQSLDAQPTAEGHALAGSISYMMGKNGLARRHWEDALRLNPDMPAVENMLQRTRTPGGRGSPAPRPLISRPAPRPPISVLQAAGPDVADGAPFPEEIGSESAPVQKFDSEGRLSRSKNSNQPAVTEPTMLAPTPTPTVPADTTAKTTLPPADSPQVTPPPAVLPPDASPPNKVKGK